MTQDEEMKKFKELFPEYENATSQNVQWQVRRYVLFALTLNHTITLT